jgi:hypothetical protein
MELRGASTYPAFSALICAVIRYSSQHLHYNRIQRPEFVSLDSCLLLVRYTVKLEGTDLPVFFMFF